MKLLNNKKLIIKSITAFAVLAICIILLPITAKADTQGTVNDNNVNIRSQADATSTSLGKVNSGDKVTIVEEVNNSSNVLWYKITTAAGTTGYIRADFVTKSATNNTTTTTTDNNNNTTTTNNNNTTTTTNVTNIDAKAAYIVGDIVNIRSQASASSDLVAKAQKNTEVTVNGETTAADGYKWYKVSFTADGATKTGFIRSDLLTFTKPTNKPAETNIDSTTNTDTQNTDTQNTETTETPDETTTEEPAETPDEPAEEPVETEPKRGITPIQPYEDPANIPEDFEKVKLGSGEDVWQKGDYYVIYGMNEKEITGWYILDSKNDTYVSYDGLFDGAKASKKSSDGTKIFGIDMKIIMVILIVLIIVLLGVVFFMALKLSRGVENDDDYDYDDYEDEPEDDEIPVSSIENSRSGRSSRREPVEEVEREPRQSKASKAKDKFLNYFTTEVDEDADDEYYDDVDEDDDDIDFIDI